uniref:NADH-ubiquinone oxidoreductase chain 5 n=1 Tax=Trigonopterus sp. 8 AH-2016 TaxID=1903842 RepID=A0A343C444_9CUCU|nr:NADH dehydrogenase subunit 5 [Trigonopterus sp. 8 AH-2016]
MVFAWFIFYLFMMLSFGLYWLSMFCLYENLEIFLELELLSFNSMSVELAIFIDWISLMFVSFVFMISSLIIMYSIEYMESDMNMMRFIYTMVLFILSMMVVVFSSNLVFILVGWDGLGLVSYLLVIYYQNVKSYNAGMLTALSNRVGDASILLSIALMVDLGSWNYMDVLSWIHWNGNLLLFSILIILASLTKSAQIPFSSWLPAAMAAPTPVSSLVHSSTLVTAGVYLLFRFSGVLSTEIKTLFLILSLFTMFMASLGANFEFDLKKIIALSTLSQLGMMMVIFFMGESVLAFFHLLMHALFKALLFMCAGVIIHSLNGCQDIRYMGGLAFIFPITLSCFSVSSFALCGLPFLSGFYSKDLLVEVLSMNVVGWLIYLIFFCSVGLTVSYSMRLIMSVFIGRSNLLVLGSLSEKNSKLMLKSMIILVTMVIFSGSVVSWVGFSTPFFIFLPLHMKLMTLFMIVFGMILGHEISESSIIQWSSSLKLYNLSYFLSSMWNLPILSTSSFNWLFLLLGKEYLKTMDLGWGEYYGSKGLFSTMKMFSSAGQLISRNHLKLFLLLLWGSLILVVFFYFL